MHLRKLLLPVVSMLALTLTAGSAHAASATFPVTTAVDHDDAACTVADCTLREAINAANATPDADVITLQAGTFVATTAEFPQITEPVAITGAGARLTIVDANAREHGLDFDADGSALSGVTVQNAGTVSDPGEAVSTEKSTTISDSALRDNFGVGLDNSSLTRLDGDLVTGNRGSTSGGVSATGVMSDGQLLVTRSTVTGNTIGTGAPSDPPAYSAGILSEGQTTILDSTVAGNSSGANGIAGNLLAFSGGGVTGAIRIRNSIVSGGRSSIGVDNCAGPVQSLGNNIEGDGDTCQLKAAGDKPSTAPLLGALADNGGPTDTLAILAGSPAINTGASCGATDQRGVARPAQGACDVGAYESAFATPVTIVPTPTPAPAAPVDRTAPLISITGVRTSMTLKQFEAGVNLNAKPTEIAKMTFDLIATTRSATVSSAFNLTLATKAFGFGSLVRSVKLKPSKLLIGKTRRFKVHVRVSATDRSGNQRVITKTIAVG
jgi:CSLREA domain-containing protein